MGVCCVFFRYVQRKVQKYFYCFPVMGCAMHCERLRTEDSTSYCVLAVISQWLLCSYIHGLVNKLYGLLYRCSYHATSCAMLSALWTIILMVLFMYYPFFIIFTSYSLWCQILILARSIWFYYNYSNCYFVQYPFH